MLQNIRDRRQGIAVRVFIGFVIAVFALFGIDSIVGSFNNDGAVVSVNGVEIDEYTVDYETQIKTRELLSNLGEDADPSMIDAVMIRNSALNELIEQELLIQTANNSGMRVASAFLDRQIAQTPDFQVDGVFDSNRAQILLQSSGYTPSRYRATLAREGVLNQLLLAYSGSGFATQAEIEQLAVLSLQKRNLRYLLLDLEGQAGINVENSAIQEYYDDNHPNFMLDEQVSLEYLEINKNDIFAEIEVSEEDIEAQYALELEDYQSQIERRASHILLEASTDEAYAAALVLAEELKVRIDAGESFVELAAQYSNDLGSAQNGGDVGYTSGSSFDQAFELALQSLAVDEVSAPVRTDFGIHLISLTEQSASEVDSFDDSRERISRSLLSNQVDNLYLERAEELGNLAFESIDLKDPADIMGLTIGTTELFSRNGGLGIAAQQSVIAVAFSPDVLLDQLNSELISLGDSRSVVVRLVNHNEPILQELSVVKVEIEAILQSEQMKEQTLSLGQTILTNVESGQNIDALLSAQSLDWQQISDLQRSDRSLSPELLDKMFSIPKPLTTDDSVSAGFQLLNGDYVVIELQSVVSGSIEDLSATEADGLKAYITQQTSTSDFSDLMNGIKADAKITR